MKKNIIMTNKNNQQIKCDVLIEFEFDKNKYIVYTDNTHNEKDEYILYKGMINKQGNITDPTDIDVNPIFEKLIVDYKNKVITGEI